MQNITFYITGHGYGHATRSLEIIKKLKEMNEELFFHIRTNAPKWQFSLNLQKDYNLYPSPVDIGAIQKNSYAVDKQATLKHAQKLYTQKSDLLEKEIEFIKSTDSKIVLSDIPPLAFEAARKAGIPGIGMTNFSWDWIYESYLEELPEFKTVVDDIRASYRQSDLLLRLPFYDGLTAFPEMQDIPLVARKPKLPKENIWQKLGLNESNRKKLVLLALRPEDVRDINFSNLDALKNVKLIGFGLPDLVNCMDIPLDFAYFPDLVNACDIIVSKPGYGIVSEIIALQKPLIYTSRADFPEYKTLVNGLNKKAISYFLQAEDFFTGNWEPAISTLLNSTDHWPHMDLNGDEVAAEIILGKF